ncbi:MAG: ribosome maturation factor RimM [Oscillospiraceae bacterium]|jgi:16S rRNA processing protein RimM
MKKFLETGKVVSIHGLKGEVKVQPWCDSAEFLCGFDTLYFSNGEQKIGIISAKPVKNMVVMKLEGVDTVEQAQKLRNKILYMDREDVELGESCFFVQDLIGLEVSDADSGKIYGILDDVSETGANDVYHIKSPDGKKLYIPAIPDVVIKTDIENGKMLIRPLKGLFDDED